MHEHAKGGVGQRHYPEAVFRPLCQTLDVVDTVRQARRTAGFYHGAGSVVLLPYVPGSGTGKQKGASVVGV